MADGPRIVCKLGRTPVSGVIAERLVSRLGKMIDMCFRPDIVCGVPCYVALQLQSTGAARAVPRQHRDTPRGPTWARVGVIGGIHLLKTTNSPFPPESGYNGAVPSEPIIDFGRSDSAPPLSKENPPSDLLPIGRRIDLFREHMIVRGYSESYTDNICGSVLRAADRFMWRTVADATEHDIRLFVRELRNSRRGWGGGAATARGKNTVRGELAAFFRFCVERGWLDRNPVDDVKRITDAAGHARRAPTVAEFRTLLATVQRRRHGKRAQLVYYFSAWAGLRRREVGVLTWSNIQDLYGRHPRICLAAWQTKTKCAEEIPLVDERLVVMLRRHHEEWKQVGLADGIDVRAEACGSRPADKAELVFGPAPRSNVWDADLARAGIRKCDDRGRELTFNCLRFLLNTLLVRADVPLEIRRSILRRRGLGEHVDEGPLGGPLIESG